MTRLAAVALGLAAGLHVVAMDRHLEESAVFAAFFAVVTVLQVIGASLMVRRPTSRLRTAVVAGNLAVLAVWAVSRTVGVPFGPHAGAEAIGGLDLAAAIAEVAAIGSALAVRGRITARWRVALLPTVMGIALGFALPVEAHEAHDQTVHTHTADGHEHESGGSVNDLFRDPEHAHHKCDLFHPCDK